MTYLENEKYLEDFKSKYLTRYVVNPDFMKMEDKDFLGYFSQNPKQIKDIPVFVIRSLARRINQKIFNAEIKLEEYKVYREILGLILAHKPLKTALSNTLKETALKLSKYYKEDENV